MLRARRALGRVAKPSGIETGEPAGYIPAMKAARFRPPHLNLFTRLKPSPGRGIGVFAIRDIPAAVDPFLGDRNESVEVSVEWVESIEDPELRRMYLDFCPVVDGFFIAPIDFNQMAQSWYLNHSDEPNVGCDANMAFKTKRAINSGEELTTDYRTFSEHAHRIIASSWA